MLLAVLNRRRFSPTPSGTLLESRALEIQCGHKLNGELDRLVDGDSGRHCHHQVVSAHRSRIPDEHLELVAKGVLIDDRYIPIEVEPIGNDGADDSLPGTQRLSSERVDKHVARIGQRRTHNPIHHVVDLLVRRQESLGVRAFPVDVVVLHQKADVGPFSCEVVQRKSGGKVVRQRHDVANVEQRDLPGIHVVLNLSPNPLRTLDDLHDEAFPVRHRRMTFGGREDPLPKPRQHRRTGRRVRATSSLRLAVARQRHRKGPASPSRQAPSKALGIEATPHQCQTT